MGDTKGRPRTLFEALPVLSTPLLLTEQNQLDDANTLVASLFHQPVVRCVFLNCSQSASKIRSIDSVSDLKFSVLFTVCSVFQGFIALSVLGARFCLALC
jgi:hypothetical protein